MKLLVIGGTRFVGKHFVNAALAGGHSVTLFNRARSRTEAVPGTEQIVGDREADLGLLAGREWDAVVDTCGFVPRVVGLSVDVLSESVGTYLFISSISVYKDTETKMQTEDAPLVELEDPSVEEIKGDTYGGLKALCERRVQDAFGDRATIVRPGLIVGPHDSSDRFTYWPWHFAREGDFLAPDVPDCPIQYIDCRDLGAFCLGLLQDGTTGTFHACGPTPACSFKEFVARGTAAFDNIATPVWADPAVLAEHDVKAWEDLPFIASFDGTDSAYLSMDNGRAVGAGLRQRPLEETLIDTMDWWRKHRAGDDLRAGMNSEREASLLKAVQKQEASQG